MKLTLLLLLCGLWIQQGQGQTISVGELETLQGKLDQLESRLAADESQLVVDQSAVDAARYFLEMATHGEARPECDLVKRSACGGSDSTTCRVCADGAFVCPMVDCNGFVSGLEPEISLHPYPLWRLEAKEPNRDAEIFGRAAYRYGFDCGGCEASHAPLHLYDCPVPSGMTWGGGDVACDHATGQLISCINGPDQYSDACRLQGVAPNAPIQTMMAPMDDCGGCTLPRSTETEREDVPATERPQTDWGPASWTCADPSRSLQASEDGKTHWCHRMMP